MEARPGVEPGWTDLQSAALPLCYRAGIEPDDGVGGGSSSSRTKYSRRRRGYSPLQSPVLLTIHRREKSIDEWRSAGESNPWLPPGQGGTLATELAERKEKMKSWQALKDSNLGSRDQNPVPWTTRRRARKKIGARGRIRTFNRWVWSPVLCQLSYTRVNEKDEEKSMV